MSPARTVLVTGANRGLGLATALEMARRGHRSVGTVRSAGKAEVVHEAAASADVEIETAVLDITDAGACDELVGSTQPDVLVNNAGYMLYAAVEEVADDDARALLDTMVIAPIRLARLCLPTMRERGWGRIIQISSLSARVSFPLMGWYQAAKQALEGVSDALRIEVAADGVSVVLIEPGVFRSDLSEEFAAAHNGAESRYAKAYSQSRAVFSRLDQFMTESETVARVVARAIEARSPRARYPVGLDAQFSLLSAPFTPDVVRDQALRHTIGLG